MDPTVHANDTSCVDTWKGFLGLQRINENSDINELNLLQSLCRKAPVYLRTSSTKKQNQKQTNKKAKTQ